LWQARPVRAARIKPGSSVRVVAVEGIRLTVEPVA
jgi:membrane protein implicated in regulation of membrane protease activity